MVSQGSEQKLQKLQLDLECVRWIGAPRQKLQKLHPVLKWVSRIFFNGQPRLRTKATKTTSRFRMCVLDLKSQAKATETTPCFEMGIPDFFR